MKIHNLPLSSEEKDRLYELMVCEGAYWPINDLLAEFDREHDYDYQAKFNGKSRGYLVLYIGGKRPSGYKSYCTDCYQPSYKTVEESGTKCGKCEEGVRKNYTKTHMEVYMYPGRSMDQREDYSDWDIVQLRNRVKLIQEFDKLADAIAAKAKNLANEYEAEQEIRMVPKRVMVLKEKKEAV
jgi:hypothetical protein